MNVRALPRMSSTACFARRLSDYVELTKPRITLMALVTVAVGSFIASVGVLNLPLLLHTLLGTALVAGGASVLNQVLEIGTDGMMRRTQHRPLPAGRMSAAEALCFGTLLSVAGIIYLAWLVNALTALLAVLTLVLYVFVYTPLKRRTSFNTLVGAIPGALPPVMGWAAVQGSLDPEAWILFLILFLWQFPHFLAIAWIYRDDYARAGLKMLPVLDLGGAMTGRQMVGYSLALLPASLAPSVIGFAGQAYFYGALCLGLGFVGFATLFAVFVSQAAARNLMRASLVYLPLLLALMMWDLSGT
jgi:protoheme IX farnesyltransferase